MDAREIVFGAILLGVGFAIGKINKGFEGQDSTAGKALMSGNKVFAGFFALGGLACIIEGLL